MASNDQFDEARSGGVFDPLNPPYQGDLPTLNSLPAKEGEALPLPLLKGKVGMGLIENHEQFDEDVEGIDTQELYDNPQRLEMIARYIVNIHDTKTRNREFTAMFCVSSVET